MEPINIEFVGTKTVNGKEEQLYQFQDSYSLSPFELIVRTGHFYYIGDDIEYDDWEYNSTYDGQIENESFEFYYTLLFDDQSMYLNEIDTSTNEAKQFLQRLEKLDDEWAPPYKEQERDTVLQLHDAYTELLSDAFDYYVKLYPTVEDVNELEQFNKSFYYVRSAYFEQLGVHPAVLKDCNVQYLMDDTEIIRQEIYKMMLYASGHDKN